MNGERRRTSAIGLASCLVLLCGCGQVDVGEPSGSEDPADGDSRADGFGGATCETGASLGGSVFCDLESVRAGASEIAACMRGGGGLACLVDGWDYCSPSEVPSRSLDRPCDLSDLFSCLCGGGGGACVDRCDDAPSDDAPSDGPPVLGPGDRFLVTRVTDGLDADDFGVVLAELQELGLHGLLQRDVTSARLAAAFERSDVALFYHTGRGDEGLVEATDGQVLLSEVTIAPRHTVIASRSTLASDPRSRMAPTAESVMGYTGGSRDDLDGPVARDLVGAIGDGLGIAEAWLRANARHPLTADRWAIFVREGGRIVGYSAEGVREPVDDAADLVPVEGLEDVLAPAWLLEDHSAPARDLPAARLAAPRAAEADPEARPLASLVPTSLTELDAAEAALAALEASPAGPPEGAAVESVVPVRRQLDEGAPRERVGYLVLLAREVDGVPVRSAGLAPHAALLVAEGGASRVSTVWPEVAVEPAPPRDVLSISEALRAAAPALAARAADRDVVVVADVGPALAARSGSDDLVPAYEVLLRGGDRLLVDADHGAQIR